MTENQDNQHLSYRDLALAGCVFALALGVYITTLAPTVTGEDSGELIGASYLTGVAHPPGYPLWCILTKPFFLIPHADMAWRANFASALWGALTIGGVFLLARRWGACMPGTWLAAMGLAFSQRFWSQSIITEVYTLNTALLVGLLHLLLWVENKPKGRPLIILGLVFGLSLSNHYMLMLLVAPGLAFMLGPAWKTIFINWKSLLVACALCVLGLGVYAYLPWAAGKHAFVNWGNPDTWERFWAHVTRSSYRNLEFATNVTAHTKWLFIMHAARELAWQFTPVLLLLAPLGIIKLWREHKWRLAGSVGIVLLNTIVLIMILHFAFDQENRQRVEVYYLPAYLMVSLWLGLGASEILAWLKPRLRNRKQYVKVIPTAACLLLPILPLSVYYNENDLSDFTIAREYSQSILRVARKNAVIFPSADYTTFPLIYLMGVEHKRSDILLGDKYGDITPEAHGLFHLLAPSITRATKADILRILVRRSGRPVYVTARKEAYGLRVKPVGLLYRVLPPKLPVGALTRAWQQVTISNLEAAAKSSDAMERALAAAVYRMHAEYTLSHGNDVEGRRLLEQAAGCIPRDHKALNNLGSVAAEYGLKDLATKLYAQALSVYADYVTPCVNLSSLALERGDRETASMYLARAMQIDAKNPMVKRLRQRFQTRAQKPKARKDQSAPAGGLKGILKQLEDNPDDPVLHNNAGTAYAQAGKFKQAIEHWQRAIKLRPDYALAHRNLALCYEKELNDPARAEYHKKEYLRLVGKNQPDPFKPKKPKLPGLPQGIPVPKMPTMPSIPQAPRAPIPEDPLKNIPR